MFAVAGSGHVVHCAEFSGSETIPLRWFFCAQVKHAVPEWRCLVHDDACHLKRFSQKHKSRCALAQDMASMLFILDKFHAQNHRDPYCALHCHPSQHTEVMSGFDSSACERVNSIVGRHKFCMRQMGAGVRNFYLQEIIETRNSLKPDGQPRPVVIDE